MPEHVTTDKPAVMSGPVTMRDQTPVTAPEPPSKPEQRFLSGPQNRGFELRFCFAWCWSSSAASARSTSSARA